MTDDEQTKALARELVGHATVASDSPTERAAALLVAATVIIEMDVGREHASAALAALIEPTLLQWQSGRAAHQP